MVEEKSPPPPFRSSLPQEPHCAMPQVYYKESLPSFVTEAPWVSEAVTRMEAPMATLGVLAERAGLPTIWHRQGLLMGVFLFLYTLMAVRCWRPNACT